MLKLMMMITVLVLTLIMVLLRSVVVSMVVVITMVGEDVGSTVMMMTIMGLSELNSISFPVLCNRSHFSTLCFYKGIRRKNF